MGLVLACACQSLLSGSRVSATRSMHRQHLPPNGSKQCFICALRARPAWCAHLSGNHSRSSWRCSNSSSSSIFISMITITIGHDHRSPAPEKPTLNPKALTPRSIAGACSYSHACAAQQSARPVNSSAFDEAAGNHHFGKLVRSSPARIPSFVSVLILILFEGKCCCWTCSPLDTPRRLGESCSGHFCRFDVDSYLGVNKRKRLMSDEKLNDLSCVV